MAVSIRLACLCLCLAPAAANLSLDASSPSPAARAVRDRRGHHRTLVYGPVTAVLAGAFAGTVLILGTALGRGSPWTTAAATLAVAVAVAFRPLRARVQDAADR